MEHRLEEINIKSTFLNFHLVTAAELQSAIHVQFWAVHIDWMEGWTRPIVFGPLHVCQKTWRKQS